LSFFGSNKHILQDQNTLTAQRLSHHYAGRIADIPLPPPSPPPDILIDPSVDARREFSPSENGHNVEQGRIREEYRRRLDAEDAALELERFVYDDSDPVFDDVPSKGKGKAKVASKRAVLSADSDSGSDLEVPRKGVLRGPAHKKRKIDKDAAGVADDFEKSVVDAPLVLKVPSFRSKGNDRQIREPTPDSLSATPKGGRKKAGSKKKLGLMPELEAEFTSHAPSVAGDVTPACSRPVSPAPTVSSIYELDEPIPPLKKAEKMDEASMLDCVKTLEETQRKVWTSIAKRDVSKVIKVIFPISVRDFTRL